MQLMRNRISCMQQSVVGHKAQELAAQLQLRSACSTENELGNGQCRA